MGASFLEGMGQYRDRGRYVALPSSTAEMGATTTKVAEARDCVSQSHNFKGACLSSSNCAAVCRTDNFPDGECHTPHFERKCFCKRLC
ncbi:Defensin Tm-AMP-D1.2 [Triticum urartu]|uniref:Defensin Tm-AMP-D1.2 n=1 Tax=Triticum urartu TaxID=4572 RepID=M8AUC6_TRIUA|nr:Defensin Tm-AMP-D1.2 [Triticum urartu]